MAMAPFPVVIPLPLVSSVPIHVVAMVLLPVDTIGLVFMSIPFVIILVLLVVIAVFVSVITAVIMMRRLRKQAIRQEKNSANQESGEYLSHFIRIGL